MNAMQNFKVQSGKAFPTVGEVLDVARKLGYHKLAPPDPAPPDINGRHPAWGHLRGNKEQAGNNFPFSVMART